MTTVWLNGRVYDSADAAVPALDHGYLYGLGCFETVRAYNAVPFRLDRHVTRLLTGARRLGFGEGVRPDYVGDAVMEAIAASGLRDARVRFSLTPGPGLPVPGAAAGGPPTLLVLVRPHQAGTPGGRRLLTATWRLDSRSPLAGVKATAFVPYLLAHRDARARGADDALLLNERGGVAEAATANVFAVIGGRLVTPDSASGPLPGVTREAVLELAPALGLALDERPVQHEELAGADEVFVTNSIIEIEAVVEIDGRRFEPGPVARRITAAYRELVAQEAAAG